MSTNSYYITCIGVFQSSFRISNKKLGGEMAVRGEQSTDGQIILEVEISTQDEEEEIWLDNTKDEIVHDIEQALTTELPRRFAEIYGMQIQVRLRYVGTGSIVMVFGVLIGGYTLVSQYQDFVDSLILIRNQAKSLIEAILRRLRGYRRTYVRVDVRHIPSVAYMRGYREIGPLYHRDAFFYFLLILCVIQFAFIIALVAGAVIQTYF
jgi:hypothetical protein